MRPRQSASVLSAPVASLKVQIGHAERRLRRRQRRYLALSQRRDPLGDIGGRPAGGIGRIASEVLDPVYPR